MPNSSLDDADRQHGRATLIPDNADFDIGLVVGNSPVSRVVVSRICERAGLKTIAMPPTEAAEALLSKRPGFVILDGGANDSDCDGLLDGLAAQRAAGGGRGPFVILLQNAAARTPPLKGGTVDAIVAKPITPDRLQPLIASMIDRVRG